MGYDKRTTMGDTPDMSGTAHAVGVFASLPHLEALAGQASVATRVLVTPCPVRLSDPLPASTLDDVAVAVVEVDPAEPRSIERLSFLKRSHPSLLIIAAVASPDIALTRTLVREGVTDVIALPLQAEELVNAALDAKARHAQALSPVKLCPVVAVLRSNGGCGATTVATHLAAELNKLEWDGGSALLADLDLQFGSVAAYLDMNRSGSIPDLMAAANRIDREFIHSIASTTPGGLAVISVPAQITSIESIDVDAMLFVIQQLRRHYGIVVLDFPAGWSNWAASLAVAVDLLLIVTELNLSGLRQARRTLDLFHTLGIPDNHVEVVLNRVEKRMFRPIATGDAEAALGRHFLAALPLDTENVSRAQDHGILAGDVSRRSPFAKAIQSLADIVHARLYRGGQG